MRKIKIQQPYASMIMSGILNNVPDIWGNVEYGEKIYIYADDIAEEFKEGINYSDPLHRKVYNEMFLGNLPNNVFPCEKYLGYVRANHPNSVKWNWFNKKSSISIFLPKTFIKYVSNFDQEYEKLETIKTKRVTRHNIERYRDRIYVPVGKETWMFINNADNWREINIFWEEYMKDFLPDFWSYFTFEDTEDNQIGRASFTYRGKTIEFELDAPGVYCEILKDLPPYEDKPVTYVHFDIVGKSASPFLIEIPNTAYTFRAKHIYSDRKSIPQLAKEAQEEEVERKPYRPYVTFISTPMGGMTRWKR